MAYPYYSTLQALTKNMHRGNFGLWYNKLIPLNNFEKCKASDERGNDKETVAYYFKKYSSFRKEGTAKNILGRKHCDLAAFCESLSPEYIKVTIKAKLESPLITGIGESHPHEVSMVFDHNTGIPYIPASTVKGIVRFAHTLGLVTDLSEDQIVRDKDGKEFFDDEADGTYVSELFGTQKNRGRVVFLDAYPEKVPELHVDIMNPHYGEYYGDDTNTQPPGDYLDPTPIKFLTVARGTTFIFRALVAREHSDLIGMVKSAITKALTEEGVGAKTAVGYGIFGDLKEEESQPVLDFIKGEKQKRIREAEEAAAKAEAERMDNLSEDERMLEKIEKLPKDTNQVAALTRECLLGDYEPPVYKALKLKLEEIGEWKPSGAKQRKAKMRKRNGRLEAKMDG